MITKSKIKTFNNTRKYIKKNKISGGELGDTDNNPTISGNNSQGNNSQGNNKQENNTSVIDTSASNTNDKKQESMFSKMFGQKESIPVSDLVTNLKTDVDTLSSNINNININIENEDANEICKNLSNNLGPIGIFINEMYKHLNNFVLKNNYTGVKIDGYQLIVKKTKFSRSKLPVTKKKLNLLIFSKIIHNKIYKTDWPPQKQRDLYIHTLRMKTGNKVKNFFKKTGESINKKISNKYRNITGLKKRNNAKKRVNNMVAKIPGADDLAGQIPGADDLAGQIPGFS